MKIAIHCGAHGTEEDRLLKSLLKDAETLLKHGVAVPGPGKYRSRLKDCFARMDDGASPQSDDPALRQDVLGETDAKRVILSNPHFFGSPRQALHGSRLYPDAIRRLQQMQALFPDCELELFIGLRNPASFLPGLLRKAGPQRVRDVLAATDPAALRWSELLLDIRTALPGIKLTAWCYEDLPFTWERVMRAISGVEDTVPLTGGLDMLRAIMTPEGGRRLASYLAETPGLSAAQTGRVTGAFLDKYALEDTLEEELDLPGWDEELVETLSDLYDMDVEAVSSISGLTLIDV